MEHAVCLEIIPNVIKVCQNSFSLAHDKCGNLKKNLKFDHFENSLPKADIETALFVFYKLL